jgi:hypothetical protein
MEYIVEALVQLGVGLCPAELAVRPFNIEVEGGEHQ